MLNIKEFTDEELQKQIDNARTDMDNSEYGSGDYNSASAELEVALNEIKRREKKMKC